MAKQKCGTGPKLYKGILRRAEHTLAHVFDGRNLQSQKSPIVPSIKTVKLEVIHLWVMGNGERVRGYEIELNALDWWEDEDEHEGIEVF